MNKVATIIVDMQNDFIDGSLGIQGSKDMIPNINKLISNSSFSIASLDYHPSEHMSFKTEGGIWTPHCIKGTFGANLHRDLEVDGINEFIYKGEDENLEAYSVFSGKTKDGRTLNQILKTNNINTLIVTGVALDYCVGATIDDALKYGFKVNVYKNMVQAVESKEELLLKLVEKGVTVL